MVQRREVGRWREDGDACAIGSLLGEVARVAADDAICPARYRSREDRRVPGVDAMCNGTNCIGRRGWNYLECGFVEELFERGKRCWSLEQEIPCDLVQDER